MNILKYLKHFKRKKEDLLPPIKGMVKKFLDDENLDFLTIGLHHFQLKDNKNFILLKIYCHSPAPLIGIKGAKIIRLASIISKALNKRININVLSYDLWEE
jgi:ribosomal protein S3